MFVVTHRRVRMAFVGLILSFPALVALAGARLASWANATFGG